MLQTEKANSPFYGNPITDLERLFYTLTENNISSETIQIELDKLSDDEKAEIRKEMMAKFDKDGDGKLSPDERKAAMQARSKGSSGKAKEGKGKGKGKGKKGESKKKES